ncbi:hypothetical protein SAMN05421784_1104 [Xenorhabdus koppenhoeferi]|uniref:Uncharacterized protein n=1 Tax=Xenorhabdus koppenhoeferi TaxID=351659 RepID=A0A1I7GU59_9GAMM|nr:hypothetical protein SAMN05421784_1104 [Xenorhabdus koppenhoeferi]
MTQMLFLLSYSYTDENDENQYILFQCIQTIKKFN